MIKCKLVGPRVILGGYYKLKNHVDYDKRTIYRVEHRAENNTAYIEFRLLLIKNSNVALVPSLSIVKARGHVKYEKQLLEEISKILETLVVSVFDDIHYGTNHLGIEYRSDNNMRPSPRSIEIYKGTPTYFADLRKEPLFKNIDGVLFAKEDYSNLGEFTNEFNAISFILEKTYKVIDKATPDIYYIDGSYVYNPVGTYID